MRRTTGKTAPALAKEGRSPLRDLRNAKGISQEALAVDADVSAPVIGRAERLGVLSQTTAAKLARVLGVEPTALFDKEAQAMEQTRTSERTS